MANPSKKEIKTTPAAVVPPAPLPTTLAELVGGATHFVFPPAPVRVRFLRMHRDWAHFAGDEVALPAQAAAALLASGHIELVAVENYPHAHPGHR